MDDRKKAVAKACLDGAEANTMTFPQVVGALMQEGFEGYAIDFRRALATYYLADGDFVKCRRTRSTIPSPHPLTQNIFNPPSRKRNNWRPATPIWVSAKRSHQPDVQATSCRSLVGERFILAGLPRLTWSTFRASEVERGGFRCGRQRTG